MEERNHGALGGGGGRGGGGSPYKPLSRPYWGLIWPPASMKERQHDDSLNAEAVGVVAVFPPPCANIIVATGGFVLLLTPFLQLPSSWFSDSRVF